MFGRLDESPTGAESTSLELKGKREIEPARVIDMGGDDGGEPA
jgi:hypothetical protein